MFVKLCKYLTRCIIDLVEGDEPPSPGESKIADKAKTLDEHAQPTEPIASAQPGRPRVSTTNSEPTPHASLDGASQPDQGQTSNLNANPEPRNRNLLCTIVVIIQELAKGLTRLFLQQTLGFVS